MASDKKLRVLLIPFFASSHIGPFTDLAISLAALGVEATVAVTPANVPIVQSRVRDDDEVRVVTYSFPAVEGLPVGVENLGKAAQRDAWRIDAAAVSEAVMRPAQEALVRAQSPDAVITDLHFTWNAGVARDLGVPCVAFNVIGAFSMLAMRHLADAGSGDEEEEAVVPRFPAPEIRVPRAELPEHLRSQHDEVARAAIRRLYAAHGECFGRAVNTALDLEERYCGMYVGNGYAKRAYMVGPLSLRLRSSSPKPGDSPCMDWLDAKPSRSVAYVCFGSLAHVSAAQLQQLALGLECSGKAFLWVVRSEEWSPPERWRERVGDRGLLVTAWAPQTAILGHPGGTPCWRPWRRGCRCSRGRSCSSSSSPSGCSRWSCASASGCGRARGARGTRRARWSPPRRWRGRWPRSWSPEGPGTRRGAG